MPVQRSSSEREYAMLVAELRALDDDILTARATSRRTARGADVRLTARAHHDAASDLSGERVRLPDGAEIVIRPIQPGDRAELAAGFRRLSAWSRLRRLREPVDRLTARQLTAATEVDHQLHEALVALDAATGEGVGEARYDCSPDDPAEAEFACTVIDAWQRRGVGTALADGLAERAAAAGVKRFRVAILIGDEPARRLLRHVGHTVAEHRDGGIVVIVGVVRRERS